MLWFLSLSNITKFLHFNPFTFNLPKKHNPKMSTFQQDLNPLMSHLSDFLLNFYQNKIVMFHILKNRKKEHKTGSMSGTVKRTKISWYIGLLILSTELSINTLDINLFRQDYNLLNHHSLLAVLFHLYQTKGNKTAITSFPLSNLACTCFLHIGSSSLSLSTRSMSPSLISGHIR